jgi:hypothetical protein
MIENKVGLGFDRSNEALQERKHCFSRTSNFADLIRAGFTPDGPSQMLTGFKSTPPSRALYMTSACASACSTDWSGGLSAFQTTELREIFLTEPLI